MTSEDKKSQSTDLLNIVERLVDNMQETNSANTEALTSVSVSLTKVSEYIPDIKNIAKKVEGLDTSTLMSDFRTLTTELKVVGAVISVILVFGLILLAVYQSKSEDYIIKQNSIETHRIFNEHIDQMNKTIKLLEETKKNAVK